MKIDIQTVNFDADQALLDFVHEKIGGLQQFFENITGVDVYLKSVNNNQAETKVAEVKAYVPGPSLYAEAQTDSFSASVSEAIDKLQRQLKKKNRKLHEKRP